MQLPDAANGMSPHRQGFAQGYQVHINTVVGPIHVLFILQKRLTRCTVDSYAKLFDVLAQVFVLGTEFACTAKDRAIPAHFVAGHHLDHFRSNSLYDPRPFVPKVQWVVLGSRVGSKI